MKKIVLFAFLISLFSCAGEPAQSTTVEEKAHPRPQAVATTQPASSSLTLSAPQQTVKSGQTICLDVTVADFQSLISMQYSMKWDASILEFQEVKGFALPHLSQQNFGQHLIKEGVLTSVWIDNSLKGVTLTDGSPIFQVCLKAIGSAGQASTFSFIDKPTPFEVVTVKEKVIGLNGVEGLIQVN